MLEGTWEIQDYQIDGVSYIDTFFKRNIGGNCHTYTFTQWKNSSTEKESDDNKTGSLYGECQTSPSHGYIFVPKEKRLNLSSFYFIDSIFFNISDRFNVLKLEHSELVLSDEKNGHVRRINFIKQ